jgi:hypothetical protein
VDAAAHFALIPLDLGKLGDLGLRGVFIQQAATEEILRGHAHELGVEIRAGCELTALHQDTADMNVQFDGPQGRGFAERDHKTSCSGTCTRSQAVTTPRTWNQKSWPTTSAASTRGCADCGVGLQSRDTDQAPEQSLNMEMNR